MAEAQPAQQAAKPEAPEKKSGLPIAFISDVKVNVSCELGRVEVSIKDLLKMKKGSVIELDKIAGEPLDLFAHGNLVGRGEGVVVNDKFGVRVTQIVSPEGVNELL